MNDRGKLVRRPFVIVGPNGVEYLGLHKDEHGVWETFLGWPTPEEVKEVKAKGYACYPATVSWVTS